MYSKKTFVLILVPPGRRRNLFKFFDNTSIKVYDIDSLLCNELNVINLRSAITETSRNILELKWNEVAKNIIIAASVDQHESPQLYLILCQGLYYNDSTREFFSVFDSEIIRTTAKDKKITISHTILIIDDIYDTFSELSKPIELYGNSALSDFINDFSKELKNASKQSASKIHMSWLHYCLNSILNWRLQEVILAQSIAKQLESKFMLWGLKQDPNVMLEWVSSNADLFYLSHPISEPRTEFHETGKWPDIVQTINSFQEQARNHQLFIVMPTAIDEYRFEKDSKFDYSSNLTSRWPLKESTRRALDNYDLIANDIDKIDIIFPRQLDIQGGSVIIGDKVRVDELQDYVNGILKTLEMSIREQLGNRDHLLVWLTDGVIVLDPYSVRERKIHGGVQKELDYLRRVNLTLSKPKRLSAVFLKSSVTSILKEEDFKAGYIDQLTTFISKEHKLRRSDVSRSLDQNGNLVHITSSLGPQYLSRSKLDNIKPLIHEYKKKALIVQFINKALLLDEDDLKSLLIIILDNINQLMDITVIGTIREFLVKGTVDDRWKAELIEIIKNEEIFGSFH